MTGRIIFMLEEPSMKELLYRLVPRLLPGLVPEVHFICIPHQGKTDLERSIPRKLKAWREPGARFVLVEDNDNRPCEEVKARLVAMAAAAGHQDTLVRLVCQELEAWYLGDLPALASAFDATSLEVDSIKKRIGDPDAWQKPSKEVERLVPNFQKIQGARLMGESLHPHKNLSQSFQVFVSGLSRVAIEMGLLSAS